MGNSCNGSVHFFFLLIATVPDTRVLDNNGNGNEYCFFLQYLSLLLMTDDWAPLLWQIVLLYFPQLVAVSFNWIQHNREYQCCHICCLHYHWGMRNITFQGKSRVSSPISRFWPRDKLDNIMLWVIPEVVSGQVWRHWWWNDRVCICARLTVLKIIGNSSLWGL